MSCQAEPYFQTCMQQLKSKTILESQGVRYYHLLNFVRQKNTVKTDQALLPYKNGHTANERGHNWRKQKVIE